MKLHRRVSLRKSPSSPPSRYIVTGVFLRVIIGVIIPRNAHAYVSYLRVNGESSKPKYYKYPTVVSNIGTPFGDDAYPADLFIAPESNSFMCDYTNFTGRPRAGDFDDADSTPLALVIEQGGGCSIEEKARTIRQINENYSFVNGPKIQFLVIIRDKANIPCHRESLGVNLQTPIGLRIAYIDTKYGALLRSEIKKFFEMSKTPGTSSSVYLTRSALDPDSRKEWKFRVFIDGIYMTDDDHRSRLYIDILFLFLIIIIFIPFVHFMTLLVRNRGLRWSRDHGEGINGVDWNRSQRRFQTHQHEEWYRRNVRDGIFMTEWLDIETQFNLGTMTEAQVKTLPIIEFGVTNIEEVSDRYNGVKAKNDDDGRVAGRPATANDDRAKVDHECQRISNFRQNAYVSFTTCSICIDEYEKGEKLILLPQCGHFFHLQCITPWLKDKKSTCPLCQTIVSPTDDAILQHNLEEDVFARENSTAISLDPSDSATAARAIILNRGSFESNTSAGSGNNLTSIEETLSHVSDTFNNGNDSFSEETVVDSIGQNSVVNNASNNGEPSDSSNLCRVTLGNSGETVDPDG